MNASGDEKRTTVGTASFDARSVETKNVSGSTAGAGSGDFHVYRQQRRRELDRLAALKNEADTAAEIDEDKKRKAEAEKRTAQRAAKRRRKKNLAAARRRRAKEAKATAAPKQVGRQTKENGAAGKI